MYAEGSPHVKYNIEGYDGDNLLDTLNDQGIQDLSVFGICNKGLACHSCRVNFMTNFDKLEKAEEIEQDVLEDLGRLYRPKSTRMACQV